MNLIFLHISPKKHPFSTYYSPFIHLIFRFLRIFAPFTFNLDAIMSILRVLVCIFFPPLAVYDRGCGSMLITFLLTLAGWVPGVLAALIILNKK